ncbi:MAG: lipase [Actinomycetota bacterium]|nr:lipase [Actinomycetota bacterium]
MLSSLAPARRRLVVVLAAALALGVLISVGVALLPSPAHPRRPVQQAVPGPLLLVPGYGGSVASLQPLASYLRAAGKDVSVVTLPGDALGDLDAQAVALGRAVSAALQRTGASSVDIVGYSAGGVVARLYARSHGGAAVARRIVTLGAPQHGTQLAALGTLVPGSCPVACEQLAPGSVILTALNAGDETPAGPLWESVWTTHDDVVIPADSARLNGATNLTVQSLCPADSVDHTGLPRDPVVERIVAAALGVTQTLPPRGC